MGKDLKSQLEGVQAKKQLSAEQIKEQLSGLIKTFNENDEKVDDIMQRLSDVVEATNSGKFDEILSDDELDRLADILSEENHVSVVEEYDEIAVSIEESINSKDIAELAVLINKQEELVKKLSNILSSVTNIVGNKIAGVSEDADKSKGDTKNTQTENTGSKNEKEKTLDELISEYKKFVDDAEQKYPKHQRIQNMIAQTSMHIENTKGVVNIKDNKKRKEKIQELKDYIKIVIGQITEEVTKADKFREIVHKFGGKGTVYKQTEEPWRRFQIVRHRTDADSGEHFITYREGDDEKELSVSDFEKFTEEFSGDKKASKFFVPVKFEREFRPGALWTPGSEKASDEFQPLRVLQFKRDYENKKKEDEFVVRFLGGDKETKTLAVGELRELLKKGDYSVQAQEAKKEPKKEAKNKNSSEDEAKKVTGNKEDKPDKKPQEKYEPLGIEESVDEIFNSEEIKEYEKKKANKERIDKYKKEVSEAIYEIESVAQRSINREQFVLDYLMRKNATKVAQIIEDTLKSKKYKGSRSGAEITFAQMEKHGGKYEDLNVDTAEEGDEKFKEITRKAWKEFAVRGLLEKVRNTGDIEVKVGGNTDTKAALFLLRRAGINTDNVTYLAPGEFEPEKINIDTGKVHGLVVLDDGTVIIDHHGDESPLDTSATEQVYKILTDLGMLEKDEALDRYVEFVNQVDNFDYPDKENFFKNYFKNAHKTILGVYRMLPPEKLMEFFEYKNPKTGERLSPTEPLKKIGLMRKFGLENQPKSKKESRSHKMERLIKQRKKRLEQMERDGLIVESERYGKICVVTDGSVNNDATRAFGCDTIVQWDKADNAVFISSLVGKPIEDEFSQGVNIRKTMWIKPKSNEEKLTMQLSEVLEKMIDGKLEPSEKLQKLLDTNGEREDRVELTDKEKKYFDIYLSSVKSDIEFVKGIDLEGEFGFSEESARNKRKAMIKKIWDKLTEELKEKTRFTSSQVKEIIEMLKDKL